MTRILALVFLTGCGGDEAAACFDDDGNPRAADEVWSAGDCGNTCTCEGCTDLGCIPDSDT